MAITKENSQLADRSGNPLIGSRQSAIADIAVTVTTGSEATPNGALTISAIATPTVVELAEYCRELRAKVEAIVDVLQEHGLVA